MSPLVAVIGIIISAGIVFFLFSSHYKQEKIRKAKEAAANITPTIPDETIAIITAAVSFYMATTSPQSQYKIASVSRLSNDNQPTWKLAGLKQNTNSL